MSQHSFIDNLIVRLVTEQAELATPEIMFAVCVQSFYNKSDYQRFFNDIGTRDYDYYNNEYAINCDYWIENITDQSVVRQWWDTYLMCINDAVCRDAMNHLFDNKAAWILLNTINKVYKEKIEEYFDSICDA
jgi:hypothetical protein